MRSVNEIGMRMPATIAWVDLLRDVYTHGDEVSPRGSLTRELPQWTTQLDMLNPVVLIPKRRLSFKFMAAEAHWILSGDDRVSTIAPYNKHISAFSDDGVKFFGAYGPKVVDQLDYVVAKLREDPSSRQAVMTTWREKPPKTRDVPCTIALGFSLRGGWLNAHVFMRSNDVWLGTPYDVFNFSMIAYAVCARLNAGSANNRVAKPGTLYLTAASSHMYEVNWGAAKEIIDDPSNIDTTSPAPDHLWVDETALMSTLKALKSSEPGDPLRWWDQP